MKDESYGDGGSEKVKAKSDSDGEIEPESAADKWAVDMREAQKTGVHDIKENA